MLQYIKISLSMIPLFLVMSSIVQAEQPLPPPVEIEMMETLSQVDTVPRSNSPATKPVPTGSQPLPQTPPTCPPKQFPSKFPDVRPKDWAYQAVNQLAVGTFRCFPIQSRS